MAMGAGVPVGDLKTRRWNKKPICPVYLLRLSGFVMTRLAKASRHSVEAFNFSARARSPCCACAANGQAAATPPEQSDKIPPPHGLPQAGTRPIVTGQTLWLEVLRWILRNVRFGSKADVEAVSADVRFSPKSEHS